MVSEVSADTHYQAADGAGSWSETARDRVSARFAFLDRPLTSFYLVLGITTLLLALGLVMVLSTSSATGLMKGDLAVVRSPAPAVRRADRAALHVGGGQVLARPGSGPPPTR